MIDPPKKESLLTTLDHVLRGTFLHQTRLASGHIDVPVRTLLVLGIGLGGFYGVALGCYAAFRGSDQALLQVFASAVKVPVLFLLTLVVTFPSLYVFAALQRLPLGFASTLRLLLLAILVHLAVIASLGPVFAFFAASTKSYAFMILLNDAIFAIGGVLGFMVLRRATHTMFASQPPSPPLPAPSAGADTGQPEPASPLLPPPLRNPRGGEQARRVLRTWCIVYGVVGAQMGWLLRPFLGSPDLAFTWFRPREDNFFVGVMRALRALFTS
jgi:hypothetical protein